MNASVYSCDICAYQTDKPQPADVGIVRGNTARFADTTFHLWNCPQCRTIHSVDPVDFADIYTDYPLNRPREADVFSRKTMGNLLKRLAKAGVTKTDAILDFGCGNGMFVQFLQGRGYTDVTGYDPYVEQFAAAADRSAFDCVVANDVLEHIHDPRATVRACAGYLKPGGLLYIGVPESAGVEMDNLEPHMMRLHQPFHRVIFTEETLKSLGQAAGLELVDSYRRSYLDTKAPFANYRFLDEFNKAFDYNMDKALEPASAKILGRRPRLLFYGLFGYFFPAAYEPAVVLRKPGTADPAPPNAGQVPRTSRNE